MAEDELALNEQKSSGFDEDQVCNICCIVLGEENEDKRNKSLCTTTVWFIPYPSALGAQFQKLSEPKNS